MCPTALGRKEKKLSNVHIVQWSSLGDCRSEYIIVLNDIMQCQLSPSKDFQIIVLYTTQFKPIVYLSRLRPDQCSRSGRSRDQRSAFRISCVAFE